MEQLLLEAHGDVRQLVADFLSSGSHSKRPSSLLAGRVLLVDEVDVFCSEQFFGGSYNPMLALRSGEVSALMQHVYSLKAAFDLPTVKKHPTYQKALSSVRRSSARA